jgi:hypothetical protein
MPHPYLWQDVGVSDTTSGYPGAPPGWYPDPAGGPGQRWWDGYAWNEATILPQASPPPPQPQWGTPPAGSAGPANPVGSPGQPPWAVASTHLATYNTSGLVGTELSMVAVGRLALAFPGVYALVLLIFVRVNSSQMRAVGHQYHRIFEAAQHNQTIPTLNLPTFNGATSSLASVAWFVGLSAIVISLIWQHRAASAGRALGLPALHSPAWGVGSHFVPIVGFWFPYQAIRDCLPPGDPNRAVVLRYWLFFLFSGLLLVAALFASVFSSGAALGLTIPAALLALGVIATGPQVVTTIAASHRAALERPAQATTV